MGNKNLTKILFCIYFAALIWIILFKMQMPFSNTGQIRSVNLIPFAGSAVVNDSIDVSEIVNNVLIFVPFGVFSSMMAASKNWVQRLAPSFFTSLALEILQFVFAAGVSDITDLLTNTFGGLIGLGIFWICSKIWKRKVHAVLNTILLLGASVMLLLVGVLLIANR